jgi:glycosyltransferase involved in cell wall biosynthesis
MESQSPIPTHTTAGYEGYVNLQGLRDYSIIILCKTFLKGGAEKQAIMLARLIAENGIDVTLVNWSGLRIDPDNKAFIDYNSIRHIGLEGNAIRKFRILMKIAGNNSKTVILSYLTLSNIVAGILRLSLRNLITIGGIRTEQLPFPKLVFERYVHNHLNTYTVSNSHAAMETMVAHGFIPAKFMVIHNAIQVHGLNRPPRSPEMITIITVSRFVRSKDLHTALHAYKSLVELNPDRTLRYRIVGYGYQETAIRTMISTLDLFGNVEVIIRPKGVFGLLQDADIYLSTSLYEGLSNSIMEAMAAGLPVVATDVGDTKYLVDNDFNGYLVPSKNVGAIVTRLQHLVDDDVKRKELGMNSYKKITAEFSEERLYDKYIRLLERFSGSEPLKPDKE